MKKTKSFLLTKLILVLVAVCLMALPFAACDGDTNGPDTGESKTASYYCIVDGTEYTVSLDGTSFSLVIAGETKTGTFNLKGNTLVINPTDGEAITATLTGDELTLTYKGKEYAFLENKTFTVTFELDGGTGVANSTVRNGQKVQSPATAPVKEGYTFVGWFSDSACTKPYNFDVNERGNVTVYAKFIQNTSSFVFTATFMNGDEQVGTMQTVNGKLYNLPELTAEGKKFLGWWISQYGDKEKLSYKYENQDIEENTVLYAVWDTDGIAVSVSDKRISWNAQGNNVRYAVEITLPDGTEVEDPALLNCMQNYVDYDMTNVAGDYIITVRYGSKTGTAYYRHMGLVKVSDFTVEGNTLKFAPVPKAEGYKLTVTCENPEHNHTAAIDLKTATEYDFSSCGMTENGLSFVVEAYADGYISSYSEKYVLVRKLDKVSGLAADENMDEATWTAVENAEKYIVNIITAAGTEQKETTETKIDLRAYSGEFTVSVTAEAKCYVSSEAATLSLKKTKLATPSGFAFVNGTFTWNAVDNATGYIIKIGNAEFTLGAAELSFTLTEEDYAKTGNAETAAVKAVGGTIEGEKYSDSDYTASLNFGEGALESTLAYQNGKVTWNGVFGATGYSVKVNGEVVLDNQNVTEYALKLKDKNTKVAVCYYRGDKASQWIEITVQAYKITYVTGKDEDMYEYLTEGDFYGLPEVTRVGYTFASWLLDGEKVNASTKFFANQDISLVAQWNANTYKVTLDVRGGGTIKEATKTVTYGSKFELGTAETNDPLTAFAGWYTEPNGKGIQYTDYLGSSIAEYRRSGDCTLYAYWVEVFEFDLTNNGTEYAVSGGPGIGFMSTVTVPGNYNGKKVTSVVSFNGCSNMVELNLPDTITNVEVGMDGGYESGAAFNGCRNLLYVNVYHVEGARNPRYKSVDGILYKKQETGGYELAYYPRYREGAYVIPSDVVELPAKSLYQKSNITEITIPSSVIKIGEGAFQSCSSLLRVTFISSETEQEMTVGANIFKSCYKLEEVTLPSYMKEIDVTMFDGCSAMQNVFIENNANYKSIDGVLCKLNEATKQFDTIVYFPKGRATEYTIPQGIFTIAKGAFKSAKITKLTIPAYVTFIDEEAFMSCTSITELSFEGKANDSDLTIMNKAFYGLNKITELTLPENLKVLKKNAFGGTTALRTLNLNIVRTVVDYEEYAFHTDHATSPTGYLYYVNIGKDTPKVDNFGNVFGGSSLKEINVDEQNQSYFSQEGVLFSKTLGENAEIEIAYFPGGITGEYVIPETIEGKGTIKAIGGNVFMNSKISSVVIPKTVTFIGDSAFKGCDELTTVTFAAAAEELTANKSNALELGASAFMNAKMLKNIILPQRLIKLGDGAFQNCYSLESITIPKNVQEIEERTANEYVYGLGNVAITKTRIFDGCSMLYSITVEEGNEDYFDNDGILYKNNYDKEGKVTGTTLMVCPLNKGGVVEIISSVEKIADKAFYANQNVVEISFPNGITGKTLEMGKAVFNGCAKLDKISLPQGLTEIGDNMFAQCTSLKEVFIPKTVISIGANAFKGCTSLAKVDIEDEFIYGEDEDGNPTDEVLNYLTLADGKITIEEPGSGGGTEERTYYDGVFAGCTALTEITLPKRLKVLSAAAFANSGLTKITFAEGNTEISHSAFYDAVNLTTVNFAENNTLTKIGARSFYNTAVKELTIPEGVTTLECYAFSHAGKLESVSLPSTLTTVGTKDPWYSSSIITTIYYRNFESCTSLKTVTFRKNSEGKCSLTEIGDSMFSQCNSLESIEIPASIQTIKSSAFKNLKSLTSVTFEEGSQLETIGANAFEGTGIKKIAIPESVKTIGNSAFSGCSQLGEVTFVEKTCNLESIGNEAFARTDLSYFRVPESKSANGVTLGTAVFSGCKGLTTVSISKSVSSLEGAFSKCASIEVLEIDAGSEHFAVYAKNKQIIVNITNEAIRYILGTLKATPEEKKDADGNVIKDEKGNPVTEKVFRIPAGIIEISPNALEGQTDIEKLVIPASVQSIGSYAFASCINLKEVVFEEGCYPTFGDAAFSNCYALETIKLPNLRPNAQGVTVLPSKMFDGCKSLKNLTLPANLTQIGSGTSSYSNSCYTFRNCISLKTVVLPDSLKTIQGSAFINSGIESIVIPASVEKMSDTYIFKDCANLTNVTFNNLAKLSTKDKKTLGNYMFQNCKKLVSVDLGAATGLTAMPTYMFDGCESLESVILPESLTAISNNAFANCKKLKSVNIPASVTQLGSNSFQFCESLTAITLPANLTKIGTYCFQGSGLKSIAIPDKVADLGTRYSTKTYTFANCKDLETVTLGAKVTKMGAFVFQNCTSLKSINLNNLTVIGNCAFDNCVSLKEVNLPKVSGTSLGWGAFRGCTSLSKVDFGNNTALTALPARLFEGCTSLTEITVPVKVAAIGSVYTSNPANYDKESESYGYTFAGCTNLTTVKFAGTAVTGFGYRCFYGCEKLTSIDVPLNNFQVLSSEVFAGTGITEFTLGAKLKYIGSGAFMGCEMKPFVNNSANFVVTEDNAIYNAAKTVLYYHPAKNSFDYDFGSITSSGAFNGITTETEITLPAGMTEIPAKMFYGFKGLKKIVIPEGVTKIGDYAFYGCTGLTEIVLPSTLTSIGQYAFQNTGFTAITLSESLTSIGKGAFQGSALTTVTLPAGITGVGDDAFRASALESVVINFAIKAKISSSGSYTTNSDLGCKYMFADCENLSSVTLNGEYNWLASGMFYNTPSLESFVFPEGFKRLESYVFQYGGIKEVHMPVGVNYVGGYAFSACPVEKVVFDGDFDNGGAMIFGDCDKLTYVDISNVLKIQTRMFENCTNLTTLKISKNLSFIYSGTFNYCTSLKEIYFPMDASVNYSAFNGWTEDQTIYLVGDGRTLAAKQWDSSITVGNNARIVLIDEFPAEKE